MRLANLFCRFQLSAFCFAAMLFAETVFPLRATGQSQLAGPSAVAPPVLSQNLAPMSNGPEGLIGLDVVVTDKTGEPVTGLGARDFTVLDNGQPRDIQSFHAYNSTSSEPDPPVEVVIVIDLLNISDFLGSHAKDEIGKFLRQNEGHLVHPVSVFTLTKAGRLLASGPSINGNALASEMARPDSPDTSCLAPNIITRSDQISSQPFVQANPQALECLGRIATLERQKLGRKLLIWVGPGSGPGSGAGWNVIKDQQQLFKTIVWFSTLLREARITLFSTSVGKVDIEQRLSQDFVRRVESARQAIYSDLERNVLAVESGGGVPEPSLDLVSVINGVVKDVSAFYSLSFDPTLAGHLDEYHDLKVQMSNRGLIARTNTAYYDQPFYTYLPNPAARRVTAEDLGKLLDAGAGKRDGELAKQLSDLELTERLSSGKVAVELQRIRGQKSRRALVALADVSAFLRPPAQEIPADPPPSLADQRRMISMAGEYLNKVIPKLPDFFARRTMARYVETSQVDEENARIDFLPLRLLDSSEAEVLYRQGREVVDSNAERRARHQFQGPNLTTYGVFGPALEITRGIVADPGITTWNRWEQAGSERRAVFDYKVSPGRSLYHLLACCLPDGDGRMRFDRLTGYHGEISIDPASGAVLGFEVQADLKGAVPVLRSDMMVAYRPVEIGGKTYICPVKSVSIVTMRSVRILTFWGASFMTYGPYGTVMNDFVFDKYHMFRTTSRFLPANSTAPE